MHMVLCASISGVDRDSVFEGEISKPTRRVEGRDFLVTTARFGDDGISFLKE